MFSKLFGGFRRRGRDVDQGESEFFSFDASKIDLDKIDNLNSILEPPCTTEDPGAWDKHWRRLTDFGLGHFSELFVNDNDITNFLRENNCRKVLCAGNGISQEPKALSAAGFEVTALDLSPVAMEICEGTDFDDAYRRMLIDDELLQPGGSVSYVVGDIIDRTVCPGPFDMIIERRTAQIFEGSKMDEALAALSNRLSDGGVIFTHCHDAGWRPGDKREPRTARWFIDQGWAVWDRHEMINSGKSSRLAWTFFTTG